MSYETRVRHRTNTDELTPEEYEVKQAIEDAGYQYDHNNLTSFVPTSKLFGVYRQWISGKTYRQSQDQPPEDLNLKQFGFALRWIYNVADRKTRRRYHGSQEYGYLGFVGPDSLETYSWPGRPTNESRIKDT